MRPNSEITFEVQIKTLDGLPARPNSIIRSPAKRSWYATLNVGIASERTKATIRGINGSVLWDEKFTFTISKKDRSSAKFALYRAYGGSNDEKVAEAKELDLIEGSRDKEITVDLLDAHSGTINYGQLRIQIQVQLPNVELALIETSGQPLLTTGQLYKMASAPHSWQRFLSAFQQAIELARQISELNDTAKAAVGVISFALAVVVKQIERDERVNELQDLMSTLLLFFRDIQTLQQSDFLRDVLKRLLHQVSECVYFVLQYQEIESFVERTAVHLTSNTDNVLKQFFTLFTTFRAELALGTSLQTAIHTEYILNMVNEIDVFLHINRLRHLEGSGRRVDKKCPPKSQEYTIERILKWISGFERGVFTLAGPSGFGKSGVLHTIAEYLDENGRLGAGIFLNEHTRGQKTADALMQTILYYLALSHPCLGKKIASAIARHPSLDSADAARCGTLLSDVTRDLALYGPLVVIVDGIHELETPEDAMLVQSMLSRVAGLSHNNLRFIISTRRGISMILRHLPESEQAQIDFDKVVRVQSARSLKWTSLVCNLAQDAPQLMKVVLQQLGCGGSSPISEKAALSQLRAAVAGALRIDSVDYDFLHLAPGSRVFTPGRLLNMSLTELGLFKKRQVAQVNNLNEFEAVDIRSLSELLGPTNPPFLPMNSPLNVYQICLRDASEVGQGPVYARIALPVSEPLIGGEDIKDEFRWYGVCSSDFDDMSANSPPEGCEWITIHHKFFNAETKDGHTSVTVATPVITQATLERLVCIWVCWGDWAQEGTCMLLRDGKEETDFLMKSDFTNVVYHGTHSELSKGAEMRGTLRPGDQIQVVAKDNNWIPSAVIAMALRY